MEGTKNFNLHTFGRKNQRVHASANLGRILLRPDVHEIVERFGSVARNSSGETWMDIVPPISAKRLPEFKRLLVELEQTLTRTVHLQPLIKSRY